MRKSRPVTVKKAPVAVRMPEEYSAELRVLQAQADKLGADHDAAIREIRLRAAVVTTRAALAMGMSVQRLDSMRLTINQNGVHEWLPQPKETV